MTPRRLLEEAGFEVRDAAEPHLCCGSAGTYSVLQAEISDRLGQRKAKALNESGAEVIATGNLGCLLHISRFSRQPVVHTVELLDWATGGQQPAGIPETDSVTCSRELAAGTSLPQAARP